MKAADDMDTDRHKQQQQKMQRMKECQWQSGKFGMLSVVLGGTVSFAFLKLLPPGKIANNNVPLFALDNSRQSVKRFSQTLLDSSVFGLRGPVFGTLYFEKKSKIISGCAAAVGWITSVMVMRSCRQNQKLVADIASGYDANKTDSKPNKYGDQNFFQEERK